MCLEDTGLSPVRGFVSASMRRDEATVSLLSAGLHNRGDLESILGLRGVNQLLCAGAAMCIRSKLPVRAPVYASFLCSAASLRASRGRFCAGDSSTCARFSFCCVFVFERVYLIRRDWPRDPQSYLIAGVTGPPHRRDSHRSPREARGGP